MATRQSVVGNKDFTAASVVIIGAGISGICTAIDLIQRNRSRNFVILEKSSSVGGTWNDNKYPGCCCDGMVLMFLRELTGIMANETSLEYAVQFLVCPEAGLDQRVSRAGRVAGVFAIFFQDEGTAMEVLTRQTYLIEVAEKYGLYKHIRFNSTVEEARWDDATHKWKVAVNVGGAKDSQFVDAYEIQSDFLVSAVGQLNVPREPEIPGLHDFQGRMMHSARWDWSYDMKGKRIAVIGNGATAAQIVPEVAKEASHLTVYQRTPNWIVPRADRSVSSVEKALFSYIPPIHWGKRALQMDFREYLHGAVTDGNSSLAQQMRDVSTDALKKQLPDKPELWESLIPNYSPGCKRVLLTDDYYPTLNQQHVDLETRAITRITETGIETAGGDVQEYDLIVLATGFRTVEFMFPIEVYGRQGRALSDIWKGGAMAYYGVTVEDLPNFAMLYGPNTNLGHNSIILMIEAQSRYLNGLIGEVLRARQQGQSLALSPRAEVVRQHNDTLQAQLNASSFADPNCNSWYKQADGRITNNWPGTVVAYQGNLSQVRWEDYEAEGTGSGRVAGKRATHIGRVSEGNVMGKLGMVAGMVGVVLAAGRYYRMLV